MAPDASDYERYRKSLDRADLVTVLACLVLLFLGIIILPRWWALAWVLTIGAFYIRLTFVVLDRERKALTGWLPEPRRGRESH